MNPSGLRLEEKKSEEMRSQTSYKSTQSSRSSVLQRAREYNRRIDEQKQIEGRSQSVERKAGEMNGTADSTSPRSQSVGRTPQPAQSAASAPAKRQSRAKALESVRRDSRLRSISHEGRNTADANSTMKHPPLPHTPGSQQAPPSRTVDVSHDSVVPTPPSNNETPTQQQPSPGDLSVDSEKLSPPKHTRLSRGTAKQSKEGEENAVVTPELLVDALSGHEDGLLAIAEKLMEHYDSGYDVMGEAIIDAFADVQKLFQHVVEAAHMEGAAFEASRRDSEMEEKRKWDSIDGDDDKNIPDSSPQQPVPGTPPGGPVRHDEFIDQDVKDILQEAIQKGNGLRDGNRSSECFKLYEDACQAASALLPVDSDHRGRLQLSLARSESMTHDRACAILRYAMDDVLRSGLRAGRTPLTDPSQRADVVLSRPVAHPSLTGSHQTAGVVQSADEALASLMEEMKEILSAPVYNDTPLQSVAERFWKALNEAQKAQQKNEEKLEQNLAKLKGEYLLARAEWEEKLTQSNEQGETWKEKYERLKEMRKADGYMDQARSFSKRLHETGAAPEEQDVNSMFGSVKSSVTPNRAASVASFSSGLAQQAKTIVSQMNNFNCNSMNDRTGPIVSSELDEENGNSGQNERPRSQNSRSFQEISQSPQRVDV